ncbi:MAG: hypothetical protein K0Q90_3451 [Paenibacillaceae bacterium]|jgi:hypothetical protein|nr:hypothetical protein [Paenibacillaceae bacterium]
MALIIIMFGLGFTGIAIITVLEVSYRKKMKEESTKE